MLITAIAQLSLTSMQSICWLAKTLPDRRSNQQEILRQMQIRHQRRQAVIESAQSG